MNTSKREQRVLHELALGGEIRHFRNDHGKVERVLCYTREGHVMSDCTVDLFRSLKRKRLIRSIQSRPYRITGLGLSSVNSRMQQR